MRGDELRFTVPGKPQPKQRARLGKGHKFYTPEATRSYEQLVGWSATVPLRSFLCAGKKWPLDARYELIVKAFVPNRRTRDLSNIIKSIEDGCNGILWNDDSQIARIVDCELLVEARMPRAEVVVRRVG